MIYDMYKVVIDENELNLRRNRIMGGVMYFDMLNIPPQPKKVSKYNTNRYFHSFIHSFIHSSPGG